MNSVEVIGFGITTAASEEEKEAAYKFIEWWNTADEEGSSPASLAGLSQQWIPGLYVFCTGQ